jgi:hypothetical protein
MKFRLVWVDPMTTGAADPARGKMPPPDDTPRLRYEQRDGAMLLCERLQNGRLQYTPLTNFTARIVGDIVLDDGEQERREFGRMNWVRHRLGCGRSLKRGGISASSREFYTSAFL